MRIGHYASNISAKGGVASFTRRVGKAQIASGHEVTYLCRYPDVSEPDTASVVVRDDLELFSAASRMAIDILHLHSPISVYPAGGVPVIRTVHNNNPTCPSGSRYLARQGVVCDRKYAVGGCLWGHYVDYCGGRRPRTVKRHFDRIRLEKAVLPKMHAITVSRYLREEMVRSGYPPERLHVLHNPAPDIPASPGPFESAGVPRLVFLGRIVREKGLDWLLRSLARLAAEYHLDIAGDGNLLPDMRVLASELGISNQVTFHGWLPEDATATLIQRARAVVFPSVWHEPAGLVPLEGAVHGRPVITSSVGGIPEYATVEYSLIVEPNDEAGLAEALERVLTNPDLAEKMGAEGRRVVKERFSLSKFLDALERLYALAIDDRPVR